MILSPPETSSEKTITLPSSKSESNRMLIIKALCKDISINNLSESDDTKALDNALSSYKSEKIIDVHHAGTSFRFLTSFLAIQDGEWTLTGSDRMKQRPIKELVDALRKMGATIDYLEKEGYPPLSIKGAHLSQFNINIDGSISSQFISSLMLIAPLLKDKLSIKYNSIISRPYLDMTKSLMEKFGANISEGSNMITVNPTRYKGGKITIESDWSAASYWFEIVALSSNMIIHLPNLRKQSLQGDCNIVDIFKQLGVHTIFTKDGITIRKSGNLIPKKISFNLINTPDLAQTIICTCAGLQIETTITGLQTLAIKETDRLLALKTELLKFGISLKTTNSTAYLTGEQALLIPADSIATYNDHRMAMCMAPLSLIIGNIEIQNPEVVSKSYPNFWKDLGSVRFDIKN